MAVLIHIELRRKDRAGDIERRAGIDRVEIREGAGVVVALGEEGAVVADADVAEELDLSGPLREQTRGGPALLARLRHHVLLDLLAHLGLHVFRDVSDAHGVVFIRGEQRGIRAPAAGLRGGERLRDRRGHDVLLFLLRLLHRLCRFVLRFLHQLLSVLFAQQPLFHQPLDEVYGEAQRTCGVHADRHVSRAGRGDEVRRRHGIGRGFGQRGAIRLREQRGALGGGDLLGPLGDRSGEDRQAGARQKRKT